MGDVIKRTRTRGFLGQQGAIVTEGSIGYFPADAADRIRAFRRDQFLPNLPRFFKNPALLGTDSPEIETRCAQFVVARTYSLRKGKPQNFALN